VSEEANSARRFFPAISELTPIFLVGLGFMYAMGLLIVNLSLHSKEIVEIDLAKPGYLLVWRPANNFLKAVESESQFFRAKAADKPSTIVTLFAGRDTSGVHHLRSCTAG
jgi:hypothetical protein